MCDTVQFGIHKLLRCKCERAGVGIVAALKGYGGEGDISGQPSLREVEAAHPDGIGSEGRVANLTDPGTTHSRYYRWIIGDIDAPGGQPGDACGHQVHRPLGSDLHL
jgi:hypothetical protein